MALRTTSAFRDSQSVGGSLFRFDVILMCVRNDNVLHRKKKEERTLTGFPIDQPVHTSQLSLPSSTVSLCPSSLFVSSSETERETKLLEPSPNMASSPRPPIPLPPKPNGTVTVGQPIKVRVNCFNFNNFPTGKIYHYDCTITRSGKGTAPEDFEARPSKSGQATVRGMPERMCSCVHL